MVVTRPREQAHDLVRELTEKGANVLVAPMIAVSSPRDPAAVRHAIGSLGSYDWIVFTSANGVRAFLPQAIQSGAFPRDLKICAIGEVTAAAVGSEGKTVDLLPPEYVAESLIKAFHALGGISGLRILLARAESARAVLPEALRASGADVHDVAVYRTVPDQAGISLLKEELANSRIDLITFTSSSSVRNFADMVAKDLTGAKIASIGPVTSRTIRDLGWQVDVEAKPHTSRGLVDGITNYYRNQLR